eukprot:4522094-Amphidinium_carterae.1
MPLQLILPSSSSSSSSSCSHSKALREVSNAKGKGRCKCMTVDQVGTAHVPERRQSDSSERADLGHELKYHGSGIE